MALTSKRPSKADSTRDKLLSNVTDKGEQTRRLNANVESSLYRRIKERAATEDRSISDITRNLWIEYLSK